MASLEPLQVLGTVLDNRASLRADLMPRPPIYSKPKKKSAAFTQGRSMYDKPCPTCYAPMVKAKNKAGWACTTHGEPAKP